MMNDLGKLLLNRIQDLRDESGGQIDIKDIDSIVDSVMQTIKGHVNSENDINLYHEIEKIADQIKNAKEEVALVQPGKISSDYIPGATLELSEVTKATEQATNTILDAAEEIQNLACGLEDQEMGQKIGDKVIEIFEASNFQDLTGQRINKVISALEDIEDRVCSLISAFSGNGQAEQAAQANAPMTDEDLLNGPQLEGSAPTQDQIDDLFDNM